MKRVGGEFAETVLVEDLEEVDLQLELGPFSWKDVDLPHSEDGNTPLITACQRGLTLAVRFLLERGADVTLCNHSNQTALHVSQPSLQGELLAVLSRPLPPQAQLLQIAWQGDLHSLQHLLAQRELVEVNTQNRDGLTPMMLALRDVDLFEQLEALMPGEYQPVEVVKALLGLSADLSICDHSGRSALHYVAQVKSEELRDKLTQLIANSLSKPAVATLLGVECFHPEEPSVNCLYSSLRNRFLLQTSAITEDKSCFPKSGDDREDQDIAVCSQTTLGALWNMRQAHQEPTERSSRGTSLPSLWDRRGPSARLSRTLDPGQLTKAHPCSPTSPGATARAEPVPSSLATTRPSQLSYSAPSLLEPLLDSGRLLRVRAHIHTRLGGREPEAKIIEQKGLLSSMCLRPMRTPKLLAPLDIELRAGAMLPGFKDPWPLRSSTPPAMTSKSMEKRDRQFMRGSRFFPLPRGGSEESSSSSMSSQSSLDLEEESKLLRALLDQTGETEVELSVRGAHESVEPGMLPKEQSLIVECNETGIGPATSDFKRDQWDIRETTEKRIPIVYHRWEDGYEELVGGADRELAQIRGSESTERTTISRCMCINKNTGFNCEEKKNANSEVAKFSEQLSERDVTAKPGEADSVSPERNIDIVNVTNGQSRSTSGTKKCAPVDNITASDLDLLVEEKSKTSKTLKNKERRRCSSNHHNQSFNVLAHKEDTQCSRKSKRNTRNTSAPTQPRANGRKQPDLIISGTSGEPAINATKARLKNSPLPLLPNRPTEPIRGKFQRFNTDIRSSAMLEAVGQKQQVQWESRSARQPKKPGITPRAKSAVDYLTYNDMFQEINTGDEGPAIYEMFATPVFNNLRASSSCEKDSSRNLQSTTPRNHQGHRNNNGSKSQEKTKYFKSQRVKPNSANGKQRRRAGVMPRRKSCQSEDCDTEQENTGLSWKINKTNSDLAVGGEYEERETHATPEFQKRGPALSVIEEVLSNHLSEKSGLHCTTKDKITHSSTGVLIDPLLESPVFHEIQEEKTTLKSIELENEVSLKGHLSERGSNNCDEVSDLGHKSGSRVFPVQPQINSWTTENRDRTMSPVFRKLLDGVGEGVLTDDLLRCLAEELISLEEKDLTPCTGNSNSCIRGVSQKQRDLPLIKGNTSPGGMCNESWSEDSIMWTKGEVLGKGAYGTVYCGLTSQGQLIAVKQVALHESDPDKGAREYQHLQEEVDLLKTLHHANIVDFLGTTLKDNMVSIFMEYVPGGSIASVLHRFGPLPEHVFALYTQQILKGVAYLHRNRVIHRDLKGNNVMLMPTGIIKLIDFGCARRLSCLTQTGNHSDLLKSVHGTPYWMAPEVINETGHGRKSDIWSIGCTVFEMATGKPPLAHMDKIAALFYIGAKRGLMPALPERFSEAARNFVQECLTSDQKDRPTAEKLLLHPFVPHREAENRLLL